ncbi:MAG: M15 family metallopeptidase [Muribaculaceae bacterium]|nr:M15 family metallopeptidase [Muribaculaceae bacterium]MCM1439379.1 M15 family metallopeptidase [Roseburia sp.]
MRGMKYLLIITVLLILLAFVLTNFVFKKEDGDGETATETVSVTTVSAEPEPEEEEDLNADNKWAMFLVNKQNPLPKNYDDIIETELVYEGDKNGYIDKRAAKYAKDMFAAALEDGVDLWVVSSYRTIDYQQQNFDRSVQQRMDNGMTYDDAYADTLREVAMPGESEHNAGLAMDIMSVEYTSMDDAGFEDTKAFAWLDEHAAEYGFILRYPKDKEDVTDIIYEPWHYRFVGIYYANEIKKSGLCLEEYFEERGWTDSDGKAVKMRGPFEENEEEKSEETAVTEQTEVTEPTEPKKTMPAPDLDEPKVTIIV